MTVDRIQVEATCS